MNRNIIYIVCSSILLFVSCEKYEIENFMSDADNEYSKQKNAMIDEIRATWDKQILDAMLDNFVEVEGGTFTMGATIEQGADAGYNEYPSHAETVKDYYMGKYEVTISQWNAVMHESTQISNLPKTNVTYEQVQTFIYKLNRKTGHSFRLPTEEEWEYAARGGKKTQKTKYSGNNFVGIVSWYSRISNISVHEVGLKDANELGLFDMSGNVAELCNSGYSQTYSHTRSETSLVVRGGSYDDDYSKCRVSARESLSKNSSSRKIGFRLVESK